MFERKSSFVSEQQHLSEVTEHKESTMSEVVSCSVGMAILKLRKNYLGNPPEEKILEQQPISLII